MTVSGYDTTDWTDSPLSGGHAFAGLTSDLDPLSPDAD
jgi:hypothetical protein